MGNKIKNIYSAHAIMCCIEWNVSERDESDALKFDIFVRLCIIVPSPVELSSMSLNIER